MDLPMVALLLHVRRQVGCLSQPVCFEFRNGPARIGGGTKQEINQTIAWLVIENHAVRNFVVALGG
jgi:hypothetical protein